MSSLSRGVKDSHSYGMEGFVSPCSLLSLLLRGGEGGRSGLSSPESLSLLTAGLRLGLTYLLKLITPSGFLLGALLPVFPVAGFQGVGVRILLQGQ